MTDLIQNHGILALGKTQDKAILHADLLEKAAHIYYMAISTGKPVTTLPESIIELITALRAHEASFVSSSSSSDSGNG